MRTVRNRYSRTPARASYRGRSRLDEKRSFKSSEVEIQDFYELVSDAIVAVERVEDVGEWLLRKTDSGVIPTNTMNPKKIASRTENLTETAMEALTELQLMWWRETQ